MILETKRLVLREFTMEDLPAFHELMSDADVMEFSLSGPLKNIEQSKKRLEEHIITHYQKFGYGVYAVYERDNFKNFVGLAGFYNQKVDNDNYIELGYRLHPKYWGQGLATEACKALCQYAFEKFKFNELISMIEPKNVKSIQVAKKIGMTCWKDTLYHNLPILIYRITNDDGM